MPKPKKSKDFFDTPEYNKLVEDIKKIIEDAARQGVDVLRRTDTLTCRVCGCYENVLFDGRWVVCDSAERVIGEKEFIIIDEKERSTHRANKTYCKSTFDFVCSECGARQEEIIRDVFED